MSYDWKKEREKYQVWKNQDDLKITNSSSHSTPPPEQSAAHQPTIAEPVSKKSGAWKYIVLLIIAAAAVFFIHEQKKANGATKPVPETPVEQPQPPVQQPPVQQPPVQQPPVQQPPVQQPPVQQPPVQQPPVQQPPVQQPPVQQPPVQEPPSNDPQIEELKKVCPHSTMDERILHGVQLHKQEKYKEALQYHFLPAVYESSVIGIFYFALYTLEGKGGLTQAPEDALPLFLKLAEKGYPPAEYMMFLLYLDGQYVKKDEEKALYWLIKAAEHGYEPAIELLNELASGNNIAGGIRNLSASLGKAEVQDMVKKAMTSVITDVKDTALKAHDHKQ